MCSSFFFRRKICPRLLMRNVIVPVLSSFSVPDVDGHLQKVGTQSCCLSKCPCDLPPFHCMFGVLRLVFLYSFRAIVRYVRKIPSSLVHMFRVFFGGGGMVSKRRSFASFSRLMNFRLCQRTLRCAGRNSAELKQIVVATPFVRLVWR